MSKGLLDGPIDFDLLKDKEAIQVLFTEAGLEGMLVIKPCECGFETCEEDVIVVRIKHGILSLQSTVKKAELLASESLGAFFYSFLRNPEAYYSSYDDERHIEFEIQEQLGIDPFEVYDAEDTVDEISQQLSDLNVTELNFLQSHNLLPLLRILDLKRTLLFGARQEAENLPTKQSKQLVSDVFDAAFLAGRLWSEYRTKEGLEEYVEKGQASVKAQRSRTKASGKKSAHRRLKNLDCFMNEVEKLAVHYPGFSEDAIVSQAYANASKIRKMPTSSKTQSDYETELRSNVRYKSRYFAIFKNA